MFNHALENDIQLLPFLTLATFCGIRPEGELSKIEWSDLKFDGDKPQVVVPPDASKTKRRRFVDISSNALEWLDAFRQRGGVTHGKIVPYSEHILRKKRRGNRAGASVRLIPQGLRHTYCSAWVAAYKEVDKLILQTGHTNPKVMWEHYHRGISEAEAKAFWEIRPPAAPENIIPLRTAQV